MNKYLPHASYIVYVTENLPAFRCRSSGCDAYEMAIRTLATCRCFQNPGIGAPRSNVRQHCFRYKTKSRTGCANTLHGQPQNNP